MQNVSHKKCGLHDGLHGVRDQRGRRGGDKSSDNAILVYKLPSGFRMYAYTAKSPLASAVKQINSELPFVSYYRSSPRVKNSCKNEFVLHKNRSAGETHIHMSAFIRGTLRQKSTRERARQLSPKGPLPPGRRVNCFQRTVKAT